MRNILIATALLITAPAAVMAQATMPDATVQEKSRLETLCSQNPASAACAELNRRTPPTTTGTIPGPGNPNRPASGSTPGSGVSGSGAGGITPGGNPSDAGGGPRQ
jgi:hypothetical protein